MPILASLRVLVCTRALMFSHTLASAHVLTSTQALEFLHALMSTRTLRSCILLASSLILRPCGLLHAVTERQNSCTPRICHKRTCVVPYKMTYDACCSSGLHMQYPMYYIHRLACLPCVHTVHMPPVSVRPRTQCTGSCALVHFPADISISHDPACSVST